MIAFLNIFFNTRKTFEYLDDQYVEDLETKCHYIFGLIGLLKGLESHLTVKNDIVEIYGEKLLMLSIVLFILIGISVGILISRYILSNIVVGLSRALKGNGKSIDLTVVTAYSLIPFLIIKILTLTLYWINNQYIIQQSTVYILITVLLFISSFFCVNIMVIGLKQFNNFGLTKSLITFSPFIAYFALQIGLAISFIA